MSGETNLAAALWDAAASYPRRVAIIERAEGQDYATVQRRAAAVAMTLKAAGLGPNHRVGVFLDGGADAVAAFFGALAAGTIAVVINESLRPREVERLLQDAGATAVITSATLRERQPRALETACRILEIGEIPVAGDFLPVSRVAMDPAQITYTAGSTGLPKGVVVSHGNLRAATETIVRYLGITAEDRIASFLPFSFVYGMSQVLCAVESGAALVVERSPLAAELFAALRTWEVTVLAAVPTLWSQLLNVQEFRDSPLPSLRIFTNAGGHLPVTTVQTLRRAQPQAKLFLMYGMTEVLRSTVLPPEDVDGHPDSIGRALPGAEVMVLRDDLTPCAAGEVGELVHRGPTVALGYWSAPEATAQVFRPNPLGAPGMPASERVAFSGDLVRRDEEGFLYFVGRRDQINETMGYDVSPDEIAKVLHASGEIVECSVTSESDGQRDTRIIASVVLAGGGSLDRLRRYCETELPQSMQPTRFEVCERLPRVLSRTHDFAGLRGEQGST